MHGRHARFVVHFKGSAQTCLIQIRDVFASMAHDPGVLERKGIFPMKRIVSALALSAACAAFAAPALAQSQGDWTFGAGIANVNPKSNNGTLAGGAATVSDETQLSLTVEYFIRDNLGIELLVATPFEHDVTIAGVGYAGSTKQLPPTLSLNYHFPTNSKITPFVGIGVNYTTFFEESSPLGVLNLDDSWGLALNAGADWQVSDNGALRLNVRYMDIETDAFLNGAAIGTAEIDPVVVGVAYVHRF
jgi:outer membrane protein